MATIKKFEDIEAWREVKFNELYQLSEEIGNKLGAWINYLNTSEHKGSKFKNRVQPKTLDTKL